MQQGVQTDAMCNIHIQQYSELLANTCCIRLQGALLRLTVLSLHSLPLAYLKKKNRKREKKLHHPLGLNRSRMPDRTKGAKCASYLRYRFRGLCDKILNEHFWG